MLGIFGPAVASIVLSRIIHHGQKEGSRKAALVAFVLVWFSALLLFTLDQTRNEGRSFSLLLLVISAAAALLPASVLSLGFYSEPGVRHRLVTLVKPRGARGYYFLALVLFPAIWGLGNIITRALSMEVPDLDVPPLGLGLVGAVLLDFFYALLFTGLSEEPGWRGFALSRLQTRFSPLVSSLILGAFWAVWHAPARFGGIEAKTLQDTIIEWIFIVLITIIFTWLYNRTKLSLLSTVLLHPAVNVTSHFIPMTVGAIVLLGAFLVFAILRDRMWRRSPPASPDVPAEGRMPAQLIAKAKET